MNDRRPSYPWVSIVSAVLLFLGLTIFIVQDSHFYFTSIDSAVSVENEVWGVNSDSGYATIFRVSTDTGIGSFQRVSLITDKRIITITDPFISDGQVYFSKMLYNSDGTFTEQLLHWNLGTDRIENVKDPGTVNVKDKDKRKDYLAGVTETAGTDCVLAEVDPPEGSQSDRGGYVQLCIRRNGEEKLLDGVKRDTRRTVFRVAMAFLGCLLIFIILFIAGNFAYYYHVSPGILWRMVFFMLVVLLLVIPLLGRHIRKGMYSDADKYLLYHCADSSYIHIPAVNQDVLEQFMKGEKTFSAEHMQDIWKYDLNRDKSKEVEKDLIPSNLTEEADRSGWDLYNRQVIKEEHCIIFRKGNDICAFYDDRIQESSWMKDCYLTQRKYIDLAFLTNDSQSFITSVGRQQFAVCFAPTELESGTRVLVGTRIPLSDSLDMFRNVLVRMKWLFMFLCGIFLTVLIIAIVVALRPLSSLKEAITEVAAGNLKARVQCHGFNELHYLARLFNVMADRLEEQSEGADSYRYFYEAFLPASLIRKMSGKSVAGAMWPRAVYRADACSLVIDARGNVSSAEERNSLYRAAIYAAEKYGGHPVEFDDAQIKLVCTESVEAAFRIVTDLQQSLVAKQRPFAWTGVAFCRVSLCVIGNDGRKNIVEQDSEEAEILSEIASELKIPVILTEKLYLDAKRTTAKFHCRCLGQISRGGYTSSAPLYELLDANTAAERALKEYSRSAFEKGVSAYSVGDYFTARNEMIKALELDPEDLVARCYILNCDRKEPPTVCQAIMQEK